ncbi:MAG: ornithine carbamoyltransferase [candidate division WOR-3 bacterium]
MGKKRDFLSITDLTEKEIYSIFKKAKELRTEIERKGKINYLKGKVGVLVFEKPSLRTRVTFETALKELGGDSIYLAPQDIGLGKRESVADVARNLSLWVSLIIARTFSHITSEELAKFATIPVINALSDLEHPCQVLGDFLTIYEIKKKLNRVKIGWLGDGNNVCHSLILGSALLGCDLIIGTPRGYEPKKEIITKAKVLARKSKAEIRLTNNPKEAVSNREFIYTDVWASMGQEKEAPIRRKIFWEFQVNKDLLSFAPADVKIMHCLPAHRGEEITDEVLDGPNAIVLRQAENRLHIQRALIAYLLVGK